MRELRRNIHDSIFGSEPTEDLLTKAFDRKKNYFGNTITYSPKVFIPLTTMCRDSCGYCTFVKSPNGRFYITCSGINNDGNTVVNNGSILEYNPNTQLVTQRHSFSTSDGKHPKYNKLCLVDFSVLSINETSLPDNIVKIYPNPVNEKINIDIDKSYVIESIKILDMKGSVLYKDKTITNNTIVNTSFLTSGHYLLFIQTNKGSITKKILKE